MEKELMLETTTKMEPVEYVIINGKDIKRATLVDILEMFDFEKEVKSYDINCSSSTLDELVEVGLLAKKYGERQSTVYSINLDMKEKIEKYLNSEG